MSEENGDLPEGWEEVKIGDVVEPRIKQGEPKSEFLYVDIGSVNNQSKQIVEPKSFSNGEIVPSRARQHLCHNDVLVSMTRPNLNAVAKVPKELDNAIGSTGFDVLRAKQVCPDWLFLAVRTTKFVDDMSELVQGALYPAVRPSDIRDFSIPLPPLSEQKRIVAKIEALQARSRKAREALAEVGPLLEQFRQSVLAAAFRGDLTADCVAHPEVEPASELLTRIRTERLRKWEAAYPKKKYVEPEPVDESELPELPEGWAWATIDTMAFVTKLAGFEYTKYVEYDDKGDLAVIKAENAGPLGFRRTDFSRIRSETVAQLTRSKVNPGDVLMVFVGAGVGQVARVPDDQPYFLGPNIAMIRIESSYLLPAYLEAFLRSPIGFELAMSFTKAVAQPSLSMGTIRQIPVAIPPLPEQIVIMKTLGEAINSASEVELSHKNLMTDLDQLDQSILAKAFRGELVPQDPHDEPASALLERIRAEREIHANTPKPANRKSKPKASGTKRKSK